MQEDLVHKKYILGIRRVSSDLRNQPSSKHIALDLIGTHEVSELAHDDSI